MSDGVLTSTGLRRDAHRRQSSKSMHIATRSSFVVSAITPSGVPSPHSDPWISRAVRRERKKSSPQTGFMFSGTPENRVPLVSSIRSMRETKAQNACARSTLGIWLRFSKVCGSRKPMACGARHCRVVDDLHRPAERRAVVEVHPPAREMVRLLRRPPVARLARITERNDIEGPVRRKFEHAFGHPVRRHCRPRQQTS